MITIPRTYLLTLATLIPLALASTAKADEPAAQNFIKRYCTSCHSGSDAEGNINLGPLAAEPASADASLLATIRRIVAANKMPPEDAPQPPASEGDQFLISIRELYDAANATAIAKSLEPGHGNYVDHTLLFTEPEVRKAATPALVTLVPPG